MEKLYVAGGFFQSYPNYDKFKFDLISPKGSELFYITKNPDGLRSTSHHASLYEIIDEGDHYTLRRVQARVFKSPTVVPLEKEMGLGKYLELSIQHAKENDQYYE